MKMQKIGWGPVGEGVGGVDRVGGIRWVDVNKELKLW